MDLHVSIQKVGRDTKPPEEVVLLSGFVSPVTRGFFLGVKHERTTTRAATQLFLNTSPRVPDAEETSVTLLRDEVRRSKVKLRKECRRFMFLFISHQSLLKKITLY